MNLARQTGSLGLQRPQHVTCEREAEAGPEGGDVTHDCHGGVALASPQRLDQLSHGAQQLSRALVRALVGAEVMVA